MKLNEVLNLYNLHVDPNQLRGFEKSKLGVFVYDDRFQVDDNDFYATYPEDAIPTLVRLVDCRTSDQFYDRLERMKMGMPDIVHKAFEQLIGRSKRTLTVVDPNKFKKLRVTHKTVDEYLTQLYAIARQVSGY